MVGQLALQPSRGFAEAQIGVQGLAYVYSAARAARHRKTSASDLAQQIDRVNFGLSVSVLLGLTLPLLVFPAETAAVLATAYAWIANTFGWFYILTGAVTFGLVLYIAFGPYGKIRRG